MHMKIQMRWIALAALAALFQAATAEDYYVSGWMSDNSLRFNSAGIGNGSLSGSALNGPQAMRYGPDGLLYVADELNHRVAKFNAVTGAFVGNAFTPGLGGLQGPTGIAWDTNGNLLVCGFDNDAVYKYNSAGALLGTLVTPGLGGLNGPDVGMTVGPDGYLYVPSFWNGAVKRYNLTTGAFVDNFFIGGGLQTPRTILWRNGSAYVSDDFGDKVLKFDAATGAFQSVFVTANSGGLNGACGMMFNSAGELLVTSVNTDSVLRYNGTNGSFAGTLIGPGSGLDGPTFITAVPEPTTALALAVGGAFLARRRRKSKSIGLKNN